MNSFIRFSVASWRNLFSISVFITIFFNARQQSVSLYQQLQTKSEWRITESINFLFLSIWKPNNNVRSQMFRMDDVFYGSIRFSWKTRKNILIILIFFYHRIEEEEENRRVAFYNMEKMTKITKKTTTIDTFVFLFLSRLAFVMSLSQDMTIKTHMFSVPSCQ